MKCGRSSSADRRCGGDAQQHRHQWPHQWTDGFFVRVCVPHPGGHPLPSFSCVPEAVWIEDLANARQTLRVFPCTELYQVSAQIIQAWWRCGASAASRRSAVRNLMWAVWLIKDMRGLKFNKAARMFVQPKRGGRADETKAMNKWCYELPRRMHTVHIPTCYIINEIHKANMHRRPAYLHRTEAHSFRPTSTIHDMRVYVINRLQDAARLERFVDNALKASISCDRHEATDWRSINLHWMTQNGYLLPCAHHEVLRENQQPKHLRNIAIWTSHMTLWMQVKAENTNQHVMIFEDDTLVPPDFAERVKPYIEALAGVHFDMAYSMSRNFVSLLVHSYYHDVKNKRYVSLVWGHRPCRRQPKRRTV